MSESVTIGDQSFIKDPTKGWIDKKTKQPADKGLLRLLDSLNLQPVERQLKVDIDNSIEPITLSATEKYVFDRNSGWIDAKTKKPAAPDMLKLLNSLKSKIDVAEDTSTPKPTPKVKSKPKKPAKVEETTEAAPEPEEQVKGSKFRALAKGAGGILASAGAGMFGINLQKTLEEEKEKKEAEAERLQEIKDTYYTVEESENGVKKYRDAKTGRFISPKTAADYDILAQEEFKKEKRKKFLKDAGKGFAGGFLSSYGIDLQKILDEEKAKKEAAAAKANGEEEPEVDETKKGPGEKGPKALDKPSISALSNSFTNLITAFNGMDTYSKNINAIFKAQQDAKTDVAKESVLETDITPAPVATGGDSSSEYLASALPGVTEQLGTLTDLISSGALQGSGSSPLDLIDGRSGGRMSFGKKAAIVGGIAAAGAIGYYAATRSSSPPAGEDAAVKQQTAKATTQAAGVKEQANRAEKQRENILSGKSSMLGSFGSKIAGWIGTTFQNVSEYVSHIPERLAALFQQGGEYLASGFGVGTSGYAAANLGGARGEWTQDAPFITGVNALAQKWNIDAGDLLGMMHAESGIQANIQNSIGATGLIQFMPSTARAMGTNVNAIKQLSRAQQLPLVDQYFTMNKLPKGASAGQLYASVFWPAALRRPSDHVIASAGSRVYSQNAGLDVNRDGSITVGDLTERVSQKRQEIGLGPSNTTGGFRAFTNVASNVGSNVVETVTGAVGNVLNAVGNFIFPLTNLRVTSRFGPRSSPTSGASRNHGGVDFGPRRPGVQGDPVMAIGPGVVTKAGVGRGYGNVVYVDHGGGMETRYAHLRGFAVGQGQRVVKGQQLGSMGNTGIGTGAHLHFEIRRNGTAIDPLSVLGSAPIRPDPSASEPTVTENDRPGQRPQPPRPPAVAAATSDGAIATATRAVSRTYNAAASSARSAFNYLTGAPSRAVAPSTARRMNKEYQRALGSQRTR